MEDVRDAMMEVTQSQSRGSRVSTQMQKLLIFKKKLCYWAHYFNA